MKSNICFGEYIILFFSDTSTRLGWCIFYDCIDISLNIMEFPLDLFFCESESAKTTLIHEGCYIQKKWYKKYGIEHSQYFSGNGMWHEISKSYRCSRDNGEVESIKIAPALSPLKMMYEECSNDPTRYEYACDDLELAMWMEMQHRSEFKIRNMNLLQITKGEYMQKRRKTNKNLSFSPCSLNNFIQLFELDVYILTNIIFLGYACWVSSSFLEWEILHLLDDLLYPFL